MEQKIKRVAAYDRIRALAIVGIIIGSVAGVLVNSEAAGGQALGFTWHLANLFGSLVRMSVPLLLMAEGALLLQKPESASLKEVLRHRVLPLLSSLAVWSLVYLIFCFLWQGMVDQNVVPVDMLLSVISSPTSSHLWLIYLLLATYLVLPFLRLLVEHAPRSLMHFAVGLWFAYSSLWPALSGLFPELSLASYSSVNVLGGYLGYLLLGWLLATTEQRPAPRYMLIGYGVCVLATVVGTALMTHGAGEANLVFYQRFMPNIVLMSSFVFMLCRDFDRPTVFTPWIAPMAQFTLGMYFVYELYNQLLLPLVRVIPGFISLILAPPLVWVLALITVAFMRRSQFVRRVFLGEF